MEFITGLKQQEEAELEDLLKAEEGTTIILEGAVHSIRDMGEIAFVILRKREGLIQTVWEEGKTDMELSEIREGDYIHVTGQIKDEERAPHGKEVRLMPTRFTASCTVFSFLLSKRFLTSITFKKISGSTALSTI